jgi:hypothetical protein
VWDIDTKNRFKQQLTNNSCLGQSKSLGGKIEAAAALAAVSTSTKLLNTALLFGAIH